MTRPLRLEFPGALYHVTARGNRRAAIYRDEVDRRAWIGILRHVCERCNFVVHAYCQMTNHYHLVLETTEGNLSDGMARLNGAYSQHANKRHTTVGHMYQGRYKAILVQKENYLLELTRYVVLNPVRAGMVALPGEWDWSSYHWMVGRSAPPSWFDVDATLRAFGDTRETAVASYRRFVLDGIGKASPLASTRHQLILGDETFRARHRRPADPAALVNVAKSQRRQAAKSLDEYALQFPARDEAMARAYRSTAYSMTDIGAHFGVSPKTVGRAVKRLEATMGVAMARPPGEE